MAAIYCHYGSLNWPNFQGLFMLDLTIAIVNYRTGGLTIDCLSSVIADPSMPVNTRIVVADAVSNDGSSEMIANAITTNNWGERVSLIDLPRNGGFAYGNNRAIEFAEALWGKSKAYLLLNPDTVVRSGAIGALSIFLADNPKVGIAGSALEEPDGTAQACSFRFPSPLSELEGEARVGPITRMLLKWRVVLPTGTVPSPAQWVSGASMMIRREVFDHIGGLDEEYFLYYEELDFCQRAVDAGWHCWTVPQSRVVHLCGQSTGINDTKPQLSRRPTYWFDSRSRYFAKHHGHWGRALADFTWVFGQVIWQTRQMLQRRPNNDPPYLLQDFLAHRASWAGK